MRTVHGRHWILATPWTPYGVPLLMMMPFICSFRNQVSVSLSPSLFDRRMALQGRSTLKIPAVSTESAPTFVLELPRGFTVFTTSRSWKRLVESVQIETSETRLFGKEHTLNVICLRREGGEAPIDRSSHSVSEDRPEIDSFRTKT